MFNIDDSGGIWKILISLIYICRSCKWNPEQGMVLFWGPIKWLFYVVGWGRWWTGRDISIMHLSATPPSICCLEYVRKRSEQQCQQFTFFSLVASGGVLRKKQELSLTGLRWPSQGQRDCTQPLRMPLNPTFFKNFFYPLKQPGSGEALPPLPLMNTLTWTVWGCFGGSRVIVREIFVCMKVQAPFLALYHLFIVVSCSDTSNAALAIHPEIVCDHTWSTGEDTEHLQWTFKHI